MQRQPKIGPDERALALDPGAELGDRRQVELCCIHRRQAGDRGVLDQEHVAVARRAVLRHQSRGDGCPGRGLKCPPIVSSRLLFQHQPDLGSDLRRRDREALLGAHGIM